MNRFATASLVFATAIFPLFFTDDPYVLHLGILTCINIILATSLQLILTTGLLNLSHAAFMAMGAYSSGLFVKKLGMSFWLSLPLSMVVGSLFALLLGLVVLRTRGAYFFIITFAFAEILVIFLNNFFIPVFGGPSGIVGVPPPSPISIFGFVELKFVSKLTLLYLGLCLMWIDMWVIIRINNSRIGMICKSLEQSEVLSESIGIDTYKYTLLIFVLGCALASMAGVFYAHTIYVVTPYDFDINTAILLVVYMVVGGKDHYLGPFLGAITLTALTEVLRELGHFDLLGYSLTLILIMLFLPGGLISIPQRGKALIGFGLEHLRLR